MPGYNGNGSTQGGIGKMGGNSCGSGGTCVCPSCGHRQPHERGKPCTSINCPQCGSQLVREG